MDTNHFSTQVLPHGQVSSTQPLSNTHNPTQNKPAPDDYANAANWKVSRFDSLAGVMFLLRLMLLMINIFEFAATIAMYPTYDMVYFLSDWGHVITVFSIFATCKA